MIPKIIPEMTADELLEFFKDRGSEIDCSNLKPSPDKFVYFSECRDTEVSAFIISQSQMHSEVNKKIDPIRKRLDKEAEWKTLNPSEDQSGMGESLITEKETNDNIKH